MSYFSKGCTAPDFFSSLGAIKEINSKSEVFLTFDDGPNPTITPLLLDLLDKYNAKATFFVIGECAIAHPNLIWEILDRGHAVGNHSHSHPSFPSLTWEEKLQQIQKCENALPKLQHNLFRPPYGHLDAATLCACSRLGYLPITWTIHAQDWAGASVSWMLSQLSARTKPGAIVLLHDRLHTSTDRRYFERYKMLDTLELYLKVFANEYDFMPLSTHVIKKPQQRVRWYGSLSDVEKEQRNLHLKNLIINEDKGER